MNPQEHIAAALEFLALSDGSVAQSNYLLRCEILWCAAAHSVKAVAKQQGWPNRSHDHLFQAVHMIADNLDESELKVWFSLASRLHRNMYEGDMNGRDIERCRQRVHHLVHRLAALVV